MLVACGGSSESTKKGKEKKKPEKEETASSDDDNPLLAPVNYVGAVGKAKKEREEAACAEAKLFQTPAKAAVTAGDAQGQGH